MIARALGRVSVETDVGEPKIPISAKLEKWLYGEESDEWSKERLKPYAWRLMPPGMRSAKGLLNEVAYQTVEPGPVILLKARRCKSSDFSKEEGANPRKSLLKQYSRKMMMQTRTHGRCLSIISTVSVMS